MRYEMTIEQANQLNKLRNEILCISQKKSIILMTSLLSFVVFSREQADKNIKSLIKIKEELLNKK